MPEVGCESITTRRVSKGLPLTVEIRRKSVPHLRFGLRNDRAAGVRNKPQPGEHPTTIIGTDMRLSRSALKNLLICEQPRL